ncbi:hypothetical protein [Rhodopirellula sallentina]|uniref:Uncharacterized protein n=1 Tax=Rhodopirellula sallentina SM41 TaxID=1263870 RepID=M5TX18_9BACT|nr:hypothetical protein [Rhodopirellula sallentina]EMI53752.1 hypothetical protein RSSM_04815 [Rhodopirellula sallentina SM41]
MQRFTAQIALIAYVVGGWLMPAAHHHLHDHSASGNACTCVVAANTGAPSPDATSFGSVGSAAFIGDPAITQGLTHSPIETRDASASKSHDCCCDHAEPHVAQSDSSDGFDCCSSDHSPLLLAANCSPEKNVGLCALCCAISMVGKECVQSPQSIAPAPSPERILLSGLSCPLPPLCSGLSSRGPPTA